MTGPPRVVVSWGDAGARAAWRYCRRRMTEVTVAPPDLARDAQAIQALLRARPAP